MREEYQYELLMFNAVGEISDSLQEFDLVPSFPLLYGYQADSVEECKSSALAYSVIYIKQGLARMEIRSIASGDTLWTATVDDDRTKGFLPTIVWSECSGLNDVSSVGRRIVFEALKPELSRFRRTLAGCLMTNIEAMFFVPTRRRL